MNDNIDNIVDSENKFTLLLPGRRGFLTSPRQKTLKVIMGFTIKVTSPWKPIVDFLKFRDVQ